MKERIRLLAEQAKKHALDAMIKITDKEQALKVYSESYDTEFAQLIVRECAKVAWYHTPDTEELEYSHLIEDKILKHFGVEE